MCTCLLKASIPISELLLGTCPISTSLSLEGWPLLASPTNESCKKECQIIMTIVKRKRKLSLDFDLITQQHCTKHNPFPINELTVTKQKHQNHYQNKSKTKNYATKKIATCNLIGD